MNNNRKRRIAIVSVLGINLLTGLNIVFIKTLANDFSPILVSCGSNLIGTIILAVYLFVFRKIKCPNSISSKSWLVIVTTGLMRFVVSPVAGMFAMRSIPAYTYSFLFELVGFVSLLIGIVILGDYPSIAQLAGGIVAIGGVVLFLNNPLTIGFRGGLVLMGINIFSIGLSDNLARKLLLSENENIDPMIITFYGLLVGLIVLIPISLSISRVPQVLNINAGMIILYSGAIATAFSITMWNKLLLTLKAFEINFISISTILWVNLFAFLLLNEKLASSQLPGVILILIGIALTY